MHRYLMFLLLAMLLCSCSTHSADVEGNATSGGKTNRFEGVDRIVFRSDFPGIKQLITVANPRKVQDLLNPLADLKPMDNTPEILKWIVEFQKGGQVITAGMSENKLLIWGNGQYQMPQEFYRLFLDLTKENRNTEATQPPVGGDGKPAPQP